MKVNKSFCLLIFLGFIRIRLFLSPSDLKVQTIVFFAKLITEGNAILYYTDYLNGSYIFKKKNEHSFYILDVFATSKMNEFQHQMNTFTKQEESPHMKITKIEFNDQAFQQFFIQYFKGNLSLQNKILTKFYTFGNIEMMFKEFNNDIH